MSIRFVERNTWYAKGRIPDFILGGVLPEYQGMHVFTGLFDLGLKKLTELGYSAVEGDTADNNTLAIKKYKHLGYRLVSYKANSNGDHYSVIMMKWMDKCPFSSVYLNLRFYMKKIVVKVRYTPGKKKRFGI